MNNKLLETAKEILRETSSDNVIAISLNNEPILDENGFETDKASITISLIINRSITQYRVKEEADGNYYND